MASVTAQYLEERIHLADELRRGRATMLEPQDLPGAYGRVVKAIDHVLTVSGCDAVLGGGWAVWRHGYVGRVTQDVDVLIPADQVAEVQRVASSRVLRSCPACRVVGRSSCTRKPAFRLTSFRKVSGPGPLRGRPLRCCHTPPPSVRLAGRFATSRSTGSFN